MTQRKAPNWKLENCWGATRTPGERSAGLEDAPEGRELLTAAVEEMSARAPEEDRPSAWMGVPDDAAHPSGLEGAEPRVDARAHVVQVIPKPGAGETGATAGGGGGDPYGVVRLGYPGQFGVDSTWEGDGERGVALASGATSEEGDVSRTFVRFGASLRAERRDAELARRVRERLCEGWINGEAVTVEVREGVVTLSGFVERREDKRLAESLVVEVDGVAGIENELRVAQPDDPHGLPSPGGTCDR